MTFFSKISACILVSSAMLLVAPTASGQNKAPLKASFSQAEASNCAAVYGWIMTNLVPNGLSQDQAYQTEIAFMLWQYEMVAATPDANDEILKGLANEAMTTLNKDMPIVKKGEPADAAIKYVLTKENACGDVMKTAYPDNNHPVIAQLRANAEKIENKAAKSVKKSKLR